jgi:hypothetical protein
VEKQGSDDREGVFVDDGPETIGARCLVVLGSADVEVPLRLCDRLPSPLALNWHFRRKSGGEPGVRNACGGAREECIA